MRYTYRQKPKEKAVYMHHYEINEKVKYILGWGEILAGQLLALPSKNFDTTKKG